MTQSKSVKNYAEAEKHATSGYWVDPIQVEDERQDQLFHRNFRAADHSESGKVHYARRRAEKRAVNFKDKWEE